MSAINIQKLNKPTGSIRLNLIVFHWAGGSGMAFKPLAKFMESRDIAVYSITLPGRNGRGTSSMFRRMDEILPPLIFEFKKFHKENVLNGIPLVFFGHSFGGLLAYELYKSLRESDSMPVLVDKIIVSAVRSPVELTERNKESSRVYHHKQSNHDLTEYMRGIGGIPPGVDMEIVELMLPTIKGDYEVFETYDIAKFGSPVIACPITLFVAKKDASVPEEALLGWGQLTSADFSIVEFSTGGHFYITDADTKEEFYAKLFEECDKLAVSGWNCSVN